MNGHLFRFDTHIYLSREPRSETDGVCVAAVIGKYPGSAQPKTLGSWEPLSLCRDKLLPCVRNRFLEAYQAAAKSIPDGAYIRVWNLFYLCEPNLQAALKKINGCSEL